MQGIRCENHGEVLHGYGLIRCFLLAVITAFFFLPFTAWSQSEDSNCGFRPLSEDESLVVLDQLGRLRKDIVTLQADFIEERRIPPLTTPLRFEGRIYYRNNGFFFMEYAAPVNHILRIQENKALFFVKGSHTADLVDISHANGIAGNSDMFVLDPAAFSGKILEDNAVYVLIDGEKKPDAKGAGPKLSVFLEKKGLVVKKIHIEDESGDVTVISLFNVRTNLALPGSISAFELPDGVKINRINQP